MLGFGKLYRQVAVLVVRLEGHDELGILFVLKLILIYEILPEEMFDDENGHWMEFMDRVWFGRPRYNGRGSVIKV
jgi:hypothetical protein